MPMMLMIITPPNAAFVWLNFFLISYSYFLISGICAYILVYSMNVLILVLHFDLWSMFLYLLSSIHYDLHVTITKGFHELMCPHKTPR